MGETMILIVSILLILLKAISDGMLLRKYRSEFWMNNYKAISSLLMSALLAILILLSFACLSGISFKYGDNYWFIIGGFLLMKFALFDVVLNWVAGLPINYIGKTKFWDKFWQWFFKKTRFPIGMFFGMLKLICFFIGLTWLL